MLTSAPSFNLLAKTFFLSFFFCVPSMIRTCHKFFSQGVCCGVFMLHDWQQRDVTLEAYNWLAGSAGY